MQDYVKKHDHLASEEVLFNIPLRKEYLLSQIGRGKRVLDVGCLGGLMSRLIMDQNNEVWGVELNPAAAEAARSRGIQVKIANVEEGLPFESSAFDAVNAGEILEQLYDTKHFLNEARRVLRPEGLLLFTTPNLNSLENRVKVAAGGYLAMNGAYPEDHYGSHVRVFNLQKIRELCEETGFEILEVRGLFSLEGSGQARFADRLRTWPLALVARMLPSLSKVLMIKARKAREVRSQ